MNGRKISKLWPVLHDKTGDFVLIALCEDNTLWVLRAASDIEWGQITSIPTDETKEG